MASLILFLLLKLVIFFLSNPGQTRQPWAVRLVCDTIQGNIFHKKNDNLYLKKEKCVENYYTKCEIKYKTGRIKTKSTDY